jgi:ankyrin repeat protein
MKVEWRDAAVRGNVEALERLLEQGVDVDARDQYGQTALMLAAFHGHTPAVRVLAARGADLNWRAKYNLTALMLAAIGNHAEVVRALLDAGADSSVEGSGAPGFHGKTALELAEAQGNGDVVSVLRHA